MNIKIKNYQKMYWVQRIDRNFSKWIKENTLENIIKFILRGDKKVVSNFLRGFFYAEGTVVRKYTQVTQANKEILEWCKILLSKLNIDSSLWKQKHKQNYSYYVLRVSNVSSLLRFYNLVGFGIKRKNKKLREVIENRLLSRGFSSVSDYLKFIKMIRSGLTPYKITKHLSVSEATVYNWINGIKPKIIKRGITEEDLLEFKNNIQE